MKKGVVGDLTVSMGLIAITAIVWLVWDVIAYIKDYNTISYYITNLSFYSPMIPFISGVLCGHWFWTKEKK